MGAFFLLMHLYTPKEGLAKGWHRFAKGPIVRNNFALWGPSSTEKNLLDGKNTAEIE
jgi:hypothetical protein